jgi:hypothetical protein
VCLAVAASAQGLIIESHAEGQNFDKYKELQGNWIDSKNPPTTAKSAAPGLTEQLKCPSRAYIFGVGSTTSPAAARFSPQFSEAGHYYVYGTWPKAANAKPVNYVVRSAKGEITKSVQQDGWGASGESNCDQWILIGDFDFKSGNDQWVELRTGPDVIAVDPRNVGRVYSDAVQFSPQPLTSIKGRTQAAAATVVAQQNANLASLAGDSSPLRWENTISEAQKAAAKSGKNILVLFSSTQSSTSNYFETDAFNSPQVKPVLKSNFHIVKVDFPSNAKLAYSLAAFKAGTINIYNSKGQALDQISERLSPSELASRLRSY